MELVASQLEGGMDLSIWALARAWDRSSATDSQRLALIQDVAAGMVFLHDRGYVHADLKPSNVGFVRFTLRPSPCTYFYLRHDVLACFGVVRLYVPLLQLSYVHYSGAGCIFPCRRRRGPRHRDSSPR